MRAETTSTERIATAVGKYMARHTMRTNRFFRDPAVQAREVSIGIIPCGSAKTDHPTEARNLYTSTNFQAQLECAERHCDFVFILSAKHGLVNPDSMVAPYDVKMGDEGDITVGYIPEQLTQFVEDAYLLSDNNYQIDSWLPKTYFARLTEALALTDISVEPYQVMQGNCGIGEQKAMVKQIIESHKERN